MGPRAAPYPKVSMGPQAAPYPNGALPLPASGAPPRIITGPLPG